MKSALLGSALVASVSAAARSAPPDGAVTVCSKSCDYSTVSFLVRVWYAFVANVLQIQDAVDATSTGSIFIYKGTYNEQVSGLYDIVHDHKRLIPVLGEDSLVDQEPRHLWRNR